MSRCPFCRSFVPSRDLICSECREPAEPWRDPTELARYPISATWLAFGFGATCLVLLVYGFLEWSPSAVYMGLIASVFGGMTGLLRAVARLLGVNDTPSRPVVWVVGFAMNIAPWLGWAMIG